MINLVNYIQEGLKVSSKSKLNKMAKFETWNQFRDYYYDQIEVSKENCARIKKGGSIDRKISEISESEENVIDLKEKMQKSISNKSLFIEVGDITPKYLFTFKINDSSGDIIGILGFTLVYEDKWMINFHQYKNSEKDEVIKTIIEMLNILFAQ